MMTTVLANGRIFTGDELLTDHSVLIENGMVAAVVPGNKAPKTGDVHDLQGALLAPGFIDVQVNGGGGHLFNDAPIVETIKHIGRAHRNYGTTGFLPTLISDELEVIEQAIRAVDEAIAEGVPGVLGIHLEGPFLNTEKKGVHDPRKFRRLDNEHIPLLTSLKRGKTLVTLAPENASPELTSKLRDKGAIVSLGHSNASYNATRTALESGVTGFTHLFNAMSPMTSREPGVVGAALEHQDSWCGIIVDGEHVSPTSLKIALRCKPLSKFMLVTDAMPTVGMSDKTFSLQGRTIIKRNGACVTEDGTLAGSDLNMARAVRNAINLLGIELHDALNMASRNPAVFLGLNSNTGTIAPGYQASFVALKDELEVVETWIDGEPFNAPSATKGSAAQNAQMPTEGRQHS